MFLLQKLILHQTLNEIHIRSMLLEIFTLKENQVMCEVIVSFLAVWCGVESCCEFYFSSSATIYFSLYPTEIFATYLTAM
jgi:hypothetical protein